MRALRNHGLDPRAPSPDFVLPGFNYRMTEFQGALGITQLAKMERIVRKRRELARNYDRLLKNTPLASPFVPKGHDPVFQSYVCLLPAEVGPHRQELIASLKKEGVETTIGTWHMPMSRYFRTRYGFQAGDFPATDEVFARSLSLPLYEGLSSDDQQTVVEMVVSRCLAAAASA
jgi:perosamine synthetase